MPRNSAAVVLSLGLIIATSSVARAETGASLYSRIGGEEKLARIVDRLIDESARDSKTSRTFDQKVNIRRLKKLLTEQLVELSGGPKKYSGEDMRKSHAGMGISEAEFYGMVEHLRLILDDEAMGEREKNELLRLLAPLKRDIVEAQKSTEAL